MPFSDAMYGMSFRHKSSSVMLCSRPNLSFQCIDIRRHWDAKIKGGPVRYRFTKQTEDYAGENSSSCYTR